MIRKKYIIQKSFRLDEQLSSDLELLSELLQRPQNELFHMALEKFMEENKYWFMTNMIYEEYLNSIDRLEEECTITLFEVDNVKVICEYIDSENIKFKLVDGVGVIDEVVYSDVEDDEIKKCLRYWTRGTDFNNADIQRYLKSRLDYR